MITNDKYSAYQKLMMCAAAENVAKAASIMSKVDKDCPAFLHLLSAMSYMHTEVKLPEELCKKLDEAGIQYFNSNNH